MSIDGSHRIISVEISGGFLDGMFFGFSAGLNCIVGGRGTGKTTILELIRFALDRLPANLKPINLFRERVREVLAKVRNIYCDDFSVIGTTQRNYHLQE